MEQDAPLKDKKKSIEIWRERQKKRITVEGLFRKNFYFVQMFRIL